MTPEQISALLNWLRQHQDQIRMAHLLTDGTQCVINRPSVNYTTRWVVLGTENTADAPHIKITLDRVRQCVLHPGNEFVPPYAELITPDAVLYINL